MLRKIFTVLTLSMLFASISYAAPVGTAFTYQGSISDNNSLAVGTYDFEFQLWNAAVDGVQAGLTISTDAVTVSDGIFTVNLDFGADPFNGDELWLLVRVRENDSGGGFTELLPRQALTATPFALVAKSVPADSITDMEIDPDTVQVRISGTCPAGESIQSIDNTGNVSCQPVGYTVGNGLYLTGNTINSGWAFLGGVEGDMINNNTGGVGIGTSSAAAKLHVNSATSEDALRVQVSGITKLMVHQNGGVGIGYGGSLPTENGLIVQGSTGIGINNPETKLHIAGGNDAEVSGGGYMTLGSTSSTNIVIDSNEIMARNNASTSTLYFNADGGPVGLRTTPGGISHDVNITGSQKLDVGASENFIIEKSASGTDPALYATASGYGLIGKSGNEMFNVRSKRFYAESSANYLTYSDRSIKEEIHPITNALDMVNQLQGSSYAVKRDHFYRSERTQNREFQRNNQLGFIAQEVELILPQLVQLDEETGLKTVGYMGFIPVLVEAVKEQQVLIEKQSQLLAALQDRVEYLESR